MPCGGANGSHGLAKATASAYAVCLCVCELDFSMRAVYLKGSRDFSLDICCLICHYLEMMISCYLLHRMLCLILQSLALNQS